MTFSDEGRAQDDVRATRGKVVSGKKLLLRTTLGSVVEVPTDELLAALIECGALPALPEPSIRPQRIDPFWVDPPSPGHLDDLVDELNAQRAIALAALNRISERLGAELLALLGHKGADPLFLATSSSGREDPASTRSQLAWRRRVDIFSVEGRPHLARHFLELTRAQARKVFSVPEAAVAMGISVRSLARHSKIWFDLSPGLLLDLARISSVADDIRKTDETLKAIATGHSFESTSTMSRHFRRFLATSPALYRSLFRLLSLAQSARKLAENDH